MSQGQEVQVVSEKGNGIDPPGWQTNKPVLFEVTVLVVCLFVCFLQQC